MEELPRYYESKGRIIDRGKYLITNNKTGEQYRVRHIGTHHGASGTFFGGCISAYRGKLENDDKVNHKKK